MFFQHKFIWITDFDSGEEESVETSGKALDYVISDLHQGHSYVFWMEAESDGGKGPQTTPIQADIPLIG